WQHKKNKNLTRKHLEKHYKWFRNNVMNKELKQPIDINGAGLTELVALPTIGPVMAVKIVEYRNSSSHFETIEDIRNVEGVGPDMYNAIRYYIAAY
ncbi:ComEA family DNA-binding protein, partial [Thermodesulfobacteriota bacterium]